MTGSSVWLGSTKGLSAYFPHGRIPHRPGRRRNSFSPNEKPLHPPPQKLLPEIRRSGFGACSRLPLRPRRKAAARASPRATACPADKTIIGKGRLLTSLQRSANSGNTPVRSSAHWTVMKATAAGWAACRLGTITAGNCPNKTLAFMCFSPLGGSVIIAAIPVGGPMRPQATLIHFQIAGRAV
jgi:hypothetical protein